MAQNTDHIGSEIRDRAKRCEERFNACLAHPKLEKYQWLETGHAEFNLWSFGLNASHSGRSSLDYKVRQRADIREIITDLLDGLSESLEECLDPELLEQIDDDSTSGLSPEKDPENPLYFNVFNIKTILKQLTRLHIAIRKSGTQLRHHKADINLETCLEKNVNGLTEFKDDMTKAVLAGLENWKFRGNMAGEALDGSENWKPREGLPKPWENANKQLVERLAHANAKRRNRIYFATVKMRKMKARQLENEEKPVMVVGPVLGPGAGGETAELKRKPEAMSKTGKSAKESAAGPLSRRGSLKEESQAPTAATTIPPNVIIEQAPSKVAGTTITKATGTARGEIYPLPPKWPEDPKVLHIDCPYCSEPLAQKHLKRAAWNGHVSGDVLPYICFIEDCKTPDDLYRTSEELTKHVISEHGVPCWICDICTPDIEQEQFEIFETAQVWREHMRHTHRQFISDTDFSKLAELSMHKMIPPLQCPLCDHATSEIKPNIDPEITRHIHQFSLRSLPWETQAEGNLSKERLKGENSSASTNNSSNDRRQNERFIEDIPNPNHDVLQPTNHKQLQSNNLAILQQISTSLKKDPRFPIPGQIDLEFYKEKIRSFNKTSCELLLPILYQLHCSMEELMALKGHRNEWVNNEAYVPSLSLELSKNFEETFLRMRDFLDISSTDILESNLMIKTELGDYIQQWKSLVGHNFIPGDFDYVSQEENEETYTDEAHSIVSQARADDGTLTAGNEMKEEEKILNWLTSSDYHLQQQEYIEIHEEGTDQWVLDSAEFKTWIDTEKQILFCSGIPGAGKTILTALVVDHLSSRFAHDPKIGLAYIYFDFWQQENYTVEELFSGLLKQLAEGLSPLPASLKALYDDYNGNGTRPPFDKASEVLQSLIKTSYKRVFIVVDALDEYRTSDSRRTRFIEGLFDFQKCGASIFATSRPIPDIMDTFARSLRLEIFARDDDIRTYVHGQISRRGANTLRNVQAEVSIGIVIAAGGMFLLAKLSLETLLDASSLRDIEIKVENPLKDSKVYHHVYEEIMKRVMHQAPESAIFAKSALSWIICARRPLTMPELRHALAVEIGSSSVQDIISTCAGLITVDKNSDIIRLFHYTAQEYFKQTLSQWFPDAEAYITKTCVTYLSFDVFKAGYSLTDAAFEERLQSYPLYDYAAHNWGHHARNTEALDPLILDFLRNQAKVEASSQALFAVKDSGKEYYSQDVPKQVTGLHLAAYFGIKTAVKSLLRLYDSNPKDSYNRTPLSWAAENGHEAIVQLLLDKGANPEATDHPGLTPLQLAAERGHQNVVHLLLEKAATMSHCQQTFEGHTRDVNSIDFSHDSKLIVSGSDDNTIKLWDITTGQCQQILNGHGGYVLSVAFSHDSKLIASGSKDNTIRLWNAATGECQQIMKGHSDSINSVAFSHDSKLIASGSDGTIRLWDTATGQCQKTIERGCHSIRSVAFSHDSKLLASGAGDTNIKLWDTATGQCQQTLDEHASTVYSVAFSHDSKLIASGSADNTIKLWDTATGQCQQTIEGHTDSVNSVAFSYNSKLIASGSDDKTVKLWDTATGQCRQTFEGHSGYVVSVALSYNSQLIASGSWDDTVKIWNVIAPIS